MENREKQASRRRGGTAAALLSGVCLGLGMYDLVHGLRTEAETLRLTLSAITLCCGILLLLRIRKTASRKTAANKNR